MFTQVHLFLPSQRVSTRHHIDKLADKPKCLNGNEGSGPVFSRPNRSVRSRLDVVDRAIQLNEDAAAATDSYKRLRFNLLLSRET